MLVQKFRSPKYNALDLLLIPTMCWHHMFFFSSSSVRVARVHGSRWLPRPIGAWIWHTLRREEEKSPASASVSSIKPLIHMALF